MSDTLPLPLAKKKIASLIAKRFYSEHEIRTKLAKFSTEVQDEAVSWAIEQGFINDLRFCKAFVHDTLLLNPQGKRLLFSRLAKKGIQGSLIEKVLLEEYPKELEVELAQKLARKYTKSMRVDDSKKAYVKLCGYLLRRGFPEEIVYHVAQEQVNLDT